MRSSRFNNFYLLFLFISQTSVSAARPPHAFQLRAFDNEAGSSHDIAQSSQVNRDSDKQKVVSPAKFKKGRSRRGLVVVEDSIEERAEKYFDGRSINLKGEYYEKQYSAFRNAMIESYREILQKYGSQYTRAMVKRVYMDKIAKYHDDQIIRRNRERLKRVNKIETTMDEFRQLRNHFINPNPPCGDTPIKRKQVNSLRVYYRRQLEQGNQNILELMRKRGWTMDDLKLYKLPPNDVILAFLHQIRSKERQERQERQDDASTMHVFKTAGRSNPELNIDLNQSNDQ